MAYFFEDWASCVEDLLEDQIISFYTYFTIVLAEIALLWGKFPDIAMPFTVLLVLSIINVLVCAKLKWKFEMTKTELIISRVYMIVFALIILIGFFFGWLANIILFFVPLFITALWIEIRKFQSADFVGDFHKIYFDLSNFFQNKIVLILSQVVVVGGPFFALCFGVWSTPLPDWIKVASLCVYFFCSPFILYIEDEVSGYGIFDIAFDVIWSEEREREIKEFDEKLKKVREEIEEAEEKGLIQTEEDVFNKVREAIKK